MDRRTITTCSRRLDVELDAVPSKSVTHRALVTAALARGTSRLYRPLVADDTRATLQGLAALGLGVSAGEDCWTVEGCAGTVPGGGTLALGESGTSLRFLLALAAIGEEPSELDGRGRLRTRPVGELAETLTGLGATIRLAPHGGLPLHAGGTPLSGGAVQVPASRSSQFASALMLVAPRLSGGLEVSLEPPVVSLPYVELTESVQRAFGVEIERTDRWCWRVGSADYPGRRYVVEGDHSTASYFLAAPAIVGGRVRLSGLDPRSGQADACFGSILEKLGVQVIRGEDWIEVRGEGCVTEFDLEMGHAPDLVPTLATLALFAPGASVMRGVHHLRLKESDRLETLARNLRALGRQARALDDRLEVLPAEGPPHGASIVTEGDHRMAMAFAVAGLRIPGVEIDQPGCVAKSNPGFWDQLQLLAPD